MSLDSKAPAGEPSPFHLAHEGMAMAWKAAADACGLQVTGSYDPWHVELTLRNSRMVLTAQRHLMTRRGPLVELGSPFQEKVSFRCTLTGQPHPPLHLIRNRPWNGLLRLLGGYRPLPLDARYAYKGTPSALADATELLTHLLGARLGYLHIRGTNAKIELLGLPKTTGACGPHPTRDGQALPLLVSGGLLS